MWDGGSFRAAGGEPYVFSRGEVIFKPVRFWKSPLTQTTYPVEWIVRTPADLYTVKAVIDNQELDSRQSTGAIYWEGLSDLIDSNGKRVGRGYLEMTGYASPLGCDGGWQLTPHVFIDGQLMTNFGPVAGDRTPHAAAV